MTYENDPDTKGTKMFFGALAAIVIIMTSIYLYTNLDATYVASNVLIPSDMQPPPVQPATPPPSASPR